MLFEGHLLKLEPIWGNGWWDGEKTVEPPAPFTISLSKGSVEKGFEGLIQEGPLFGCAISGSPRFVDVANYLAVQVYRNDIAATAGNTERILIGYVKTT